MPSKVRRCVVDETVLLVMSISRWFALAPVRFTKSFDKSFMYISRIFVIYGLVFVVVVDFLITYATYLDFKSTIRDMNKINNTEHTRTILFLRMCDFIVSTSLVSVGIVTARRKTKSSMYCVEAMRKIKNNILCGRQENLLKWKMFGLTVVFLLGTWILKIVEIIISYDYLQLYMEVVALTISIMMELQFAVIALSIKSGFQAINKSLRNIISNLENENPKNYIKPDFFKIRVQTINATIDSIGMTDHRYPGEIMGKRLKLSHKVREISQSFVGVCDVLREFNDSESTTMLLQMTILILHIIITIFNLVEAVGVHGTEYLDLEVMALQCAWFIYHISKMILIVEPCCRTEQEVAETRILVGKLICQVTSKADPLQNETEAFYNHIMLNEVSYTVFGIFSLERPLISKVIGGVTAILVLFF